MGAFWNSWQLWEKMCFVLGSSIILVVILGFIKLAYNHWRLRQYTKLAKTKRSGMTEMQRNDTIGRRKKSRNDVPFGIRAIESGIEVDGVWISRSNTPTPSTHGSPSLAAAKSPWTADHAPSPDRRSTASQISRPEIPRAAHASFDTSPRKSDVSSLNLGNPFDRPVSSEMPSSRPGSVYLEATPRSQPKNRPTYQPRRSSHLRYSNSHMPDNADTLASLEGQGLEATADSKHFNDHVDVVTGSNVYNPSNQRDSDESFSGSSGGSSRQRAGASHRRKKSSNGFLEPVLLQPTHNRHRSTESGPLPRIRNSQVAEAKQTPPRFQFNDAITEWRTVQQPAEHRNFLDDGPVSPIEDVRDPFATPQGTPLMTPKLDKHPEPPTFEELVRSTSPQGENLPGDERFPLQQQQQQQRRDYWAVAPSDRNRNARQSQVARKINSGFEILRPGSLNRSSNNSERDQDPERTERHQSKKLFRTRDSRTEKVSQFTEQV